MTEAQVCLRRYQLAFALLITELLPGLVEPLDTYDPAFNDVDRALLSNLGVTVRGTCCLAGAFISMHINGQGSSQCTFTFCSTTVFAMRLSLTPLGDSCC